MHPDPYQAPAADIRAEAEASHLPAWLLGLSSLLLLAIAGWCFYLSDALSTLSTQGAVRIEKIEQLSQQVRAGELKPGRDSMLEYFERNREFLLDDIGYQRSAQLNFMLVGAGLGILFMLQLVLAWRIRRAPATTSGSRPPG